MSFDMRFVFWLLLIFCSVTACGEGSIKVTPAGNPANLSGGGSTDKTPLEFFRDDLFPVMSEASQANGGCASSGCHLVGQAAQSGQTFYQIDPSSVDNSWNWASVRRRSITNTDYSISNGTAGSELLKTKKDENHNSFSNWDAIQKANLETWFAIPEE